eukprot:TRINITY_DN12312_c0_g1_i1.p1 TRINITY_DN12312_c0_g1~~TRINITY_DN12312_c0_g1_i1.p1  ORF type:complete len:524 (+),score=78.99 TRINITY_DN12312_c0_g1_i1:103-1674(+)
MLTWLVSIFVSFLVIFYYLLKYCNKVRLFNPLVSKANPHVVIVGAGFAGLGLAIKLKQIGVSKITIYDKGNDIGGTWRENQYPGCACDVPSVLYSYSFEPNPSWTKSYAPRDEILNYLKNCAKKHDIYKHTKFNKIVLSSKYIQNTRQWEVTTKDLATNKEETIKADYFISCVGQLNEPKLPTIPGMDSFGGHQFHSAQWDHSVDLKNKNVVVVGIGASSAQFIPHVVEKAKKVVIFQRSKNYVVPKNLLFLPSLIQTMYNKIPLAQRVVRSFIYLRNELVGFIVLRGHFPSAFINEFKKEINGIMKDKEKIDKLIPDTMPGCRRLILSNDFLPAIDSPKVDLVNEKLERVGSDAVYTRDAEYKADVIIYATGFNSSAFSSRIHIVGTDGKSLKDTWNGNPSAYFGLTIPKFPNFFMTYGPNTNLGHNSIIFMIECQIEYILSAIEWNSENNVSSVDIKQTVYDNHKKYVHEAVKNYVWSSQCNSWYRTKDGFFPNNLPSSTIYYWWKTKAFDHQNYNVTIKN